MFALTLEDILREFQGEEGNAAQNPEWRKFFDAIFKIRAGLKLGMAL